MGDRAQIAIKMKTKNDPEARVYLYSHWDGRGIYKVLQRALDRGRDRWNDPEYLARIIFEEMIGDDRGSHIGYGIGNQCHGDIEHDIPILDTFTEMVEWETRNGDPLDNAESFEHFIIRIDAKGAA